MELTILDSFRQFLEKSVKIWISCALIACICTAAEAEGPGVVVTNHALFLIVKDILGNSENIITILPETADIHTFEPKPSQLVDLSTAKIIYANGGTLEPWLKRISGLPSQRIVYLSEYAEQNSDGALWLDPKVVKRSIPPLVEALCKSFAKECEGINARAESFLKSLDALAADLQLKISNWKAKNFLVYHNLYDAFAARFSLTLLGGLKSCEMDSLTGGKLEKIIDNVKAMRLKYIGVEELAEVERSGLVEDLKLIPIVIDPFGMHAASYAQLVAKFVDQVQILVS
jgi:ABC-type Zn uptake system ZnuABC Zn-binding protein ZnuA